MASRITSIAMHCAGPGLLGSFRAAVLGRPITGRGEVGWHVLTDPEGNEFCLLSRRAAPA
jgi:hypothetical protein